MACRDRFMWPLHMLGHNAQGSVVSRSSRSRRLRQGWTLPKQQQSKQVSRALQSMSPFVRMCLGNVREPVGLVPLSAVWGLVGSIMAAGM